MGLLFSSATTRRVDTVENDRRRRPSSLFDRINKITDHSDRARHYDVVYYVSPIRSDRIRCAIVDFALINLIEKRT